MHQTITRGATRDAARPAEPAVSGPAVSGPTAGQEAPPPAVAPAPRVRYAESAGSMAGVAVLFGVAGLFVFNVIFGPLAIGIGVAAYRRRTATARTRTTALIGAALGALDLIVLAVFAAISLAYGGFTWGFGG